MSCVGVRAVVAEPRLLVREALCAAVAATGAEVVAHNEDAAGLAAITETTRPDLVLVAHRLIESAPGLADTVRGEHGCRLLVLGRSADQGSLLAALESGADGFLVPTMRLAELANAIERVGAGETYIPPGMLSGLLRELITRRRDDDSVLRQFSRLSRREREVLRLIAEGATQAQMAAALYLSPHTVRTHVQNVIQKLGVHSRVEAVSIAIEYDLLSRFTEEL
jgi:DNA-binding NarL/FixJ family response regulator